jgi:hypothetical protein
MQNITPSVEIGEPLTGLLGELARIIKVLVSIFLRPADRISATDSSILSFPIALARTDTRAKTMGVGMRPGRRGRDLDVPHTQNTVDVSDVVERRYLEIADCGVVGRMDTWRKMG